jgi:uncharacterized repeat protein (TIGR01451 family)
MNPSRARAGRLAQGSAAEAGCRRRARLTGAALVLALPLLLLAPSTALAVRTPAQLTYTVSVTPTVAQTGSTQRYTLVVTNTSPQGPTQIETVSVTLPSGWTLNSVGKPRPPSLKASESGNTITLNGPLPAGHSVSVPITATAPLFPAVYTWATSASGDPGPFTTGSPPSTIVADQASVTICDPNTQCLSPTLTVGAVSGVSAPTDAQVTGQPGPSPDVLSVVIPNPAQPTMSCLPPPVDGVPVTGAIVGWHITTREQTLTYTVHPQIDYTYDLGDTCFGESKPFPGSSFANGEYEGHVPLCSAPNGDGPPIINPPPCVISLTNVQGDGDNDGDPNDPNDTLYATVVVDIPVDGNWGG